VPDELLTVAEVAEQLKLNPQTIRNWIDRGELSAVRLGSRRVRVRSSELERFLSESSAAQSP
jgi:excisionase family DNA binding protein